jgi:hypothetical protein
MMNQSNINHMSGTGYLLVRVSTASGAIPVSGATVVVRSGVSDETNDKGAVVQILRSDRDGNTPRIALPAPPRENSTQPGSMVPYASYQIDVVADGFYRQYFTGVPIYDGVTSIQPAALIPLADNPGIEQITDTDRYFDENVNPALRPQTPSDQR